MSFWWAREAPLWSALLSPLELVYRAGAALHRGSRRAAHAKVPLISVGNLTVGGAGKTPVALCIAQRLIARGRRPAVLSRGYGRRLRKAQQVSKDSPVREVGDEPLLLAQRGLTVFVGPRRALLAALAGERGADVLVLDDGLQHHALARDLDVIVIDATNPLGNGHLLPRGPLRERPAALRRVGPRGLLWLSNARDRGPDLELDGLLAPRPRSCAASASSSSRGSPGRRRSRPPCSASGRRSRGGAGSAITIFILGTIWRHCGGRRTGRCW